MNDQSSLGVLLCCSMILVPAVLGALAGAAVQRRVDQFGWQNAFVPGFIRRWLEDL